MASSSSYLILHNLRRTSSTVSSIQSRTTRSSYTPFPKNPFSYHHRSQAAASSSSWCHHRRHLMRCFTTSSSSSSTSSDHYDVIIIGGGVVGSTLAHTLSHSTTGYRIGLIDVRPKPPPLHSYRRDTNNNSVVVPPPNARSYALSPSSLHLLRTIIPSLQDMDRVGYYDKMQVWESNGPATITFHSSDLDTHSEEWIREQNILGALVEDGPLVSALWESLDDKVDLLEDCAVVKSVAAPSMSGGDIGGGPTPPELVKVLYQKKGHDNDVTMEEREVTANLLVAADGPNSYIRRSLSMPTLTWEYGRKALTCTVSLEGSMQRTAYQRFFPSGPIALLPMWNEEGHNGNDKCYANVVWSTTPSHCAELQSMSEEDFIAALNEALQAGPSINPPLLPKHIKAGLPTPIANLTYGMERLVEATNTGLTMMTWNEKQMFQMPPIIQSIVSPGSNKMPKRLAFDLNLRNARSYVRPRVALVGDAAHTVHPMAGQGLNLGLADVACLTRLICKAEGCGMDIGNTMLFLNEYNTERQREVGLMMGGIHALHEVFGIKEEKFGGGLGIYGRSLGMNLVNGLGPLRKQLANVAAG